MNKKSFIVLLISLLALPMMSQNPFFKKATTPYGTFPFNQLKNEHYLPAFEEGIKQHAAEVDKIANNKKQPTFANTIVALERSGALLSRVSYVFFALNNAETNDEMQEIAQRVSPMLTDHSNSIKLNEKLYERVKAVYEQSDKLNLSVEDAKLLEDTYQSFVNNGANLNAEQKEVYRDLSKKLGLATLQFGQNALKELNDYSLLITDAKVLEGMPADFMEMAAEKAEKAGKKGWLLDLRYTSYSPIMTYADNRDLRREIWMAYNTQCLAGSKYDNTGLIKDIVNLRLQIANLFGFSTYADYVLRFRMAENSKNVYKLLNDLLIAYKPYGDKELAAVQEYATKNGAYFTIQPWDFSYYSDKLKTALFNINDEVLKPYFELEKVKKGVFGLATQLYGLQFTKNEKIPVYHPEVDAYEVTDENGKYVAVLYTDFHPREGKRSGAWMTEYKGQYKDAKGNDSRPHVTVVMNFTRPTATKPALLTYNEVETFLHEFGHALHGMLANGTYESLSGTNVYRDFVELPSQIMENWGQEKEFLDGFAEHYETGEKIPATLVQQIKDASNFNCAYACLRQLTFGLQDMAFHTITQPFDADVVEFEKTVTKQASLLPHIDGTGRCTTFTHIFSGGYAAGYYSYKWAEVLDADAFSLFKQNGIYDRKTATSFKENILMKGGTEHPMVLYKRFRGKEPTIDALLERNGIKW
ncbi:MAG TPA: M3 family metallopeptidase [Paludibacteraceae bacterium]|jgi:peptidyl-dipeptidase Dcp|nr:M3 family metallopeptidase [Paludibacteraceae bacterium]HOS37887.1 M3 family metallopeptidase [Paludibacteraceae bacterium]HPK20853.1 M3 family metallopeptidase [Paludibacteraceae bacterium]HPO48450.1 M3 family metallopeptidase [Paludibacteraceae bacterium]